MREEFENRFVYHRGDLLAGKENSFPAIKAAKRKNPLYVEVDVTYIDQLQLIESGLEEEADEGSHWTGHPPSEPIVKVELILPLFERRQTLPQIYNEDVEATQTILKLDLKGKEGQDYYKSINDLLSLLDGFNLDLVLLNLPGFGKVSAMDAQLHLATQVGQGTNIKLNIDMGHYRPKGKLIDSAIHKHVSALGDLVYVISPEANKEDMDMMGEFARDHEIPYVSFWLPGLPGETNPRVTEERLLHAIGLEQKYPSIKVVFGMNPHFVQYP